mmetsp:Transcript_96855/g.133408  ORF Transcript_96855/g.133408 Transcript_96855/m.133408 type:complete len:84 (+) Transcript_96855:187-438(+)
MQKHEKRKRAPKTKEELAKLRKNMMKSSKCRDQAASPSTPNSIYTAATGADGGFSNFGGKEPMTIEDQKKLQLMQRLAQGKKT